MIGFNGKYLDAAAIGDMRITAMSQGDKWLLYGLDYLVVATKAAILSAFGAEEGAGVIQATNAYLNGLVTTDREKAQRLANCINEDPMFVCSIVETSKTRSFIAGGANAIDLGIITTNATVLKGKFVFTQNSGSAHIGHAISGDSSDWRLFNTGSTLYWDCGSRRITQPCALNTLVEIEIGDAYIILNGTKKSSTAGTTIAAGFIIYAEDAAINCYGNIEIYDGENWHIFAPHQAANGDVGFFDMFAMTTHFITSGSATIQLTDK